MKSYVINQIILISVIVYTFRLTWTMWCCRQVTDDGLLQFSSLQTLQTLVMNNLGEGVSGSFLSRLQGECSPMTHVLHLPFSSALVTACLLNRPLTVFTAGHSLSGCLQQNKPPMCTQHQATLLFAAFYNVSSSMGDVSALPSCLPPCQGIQAKLCY